MASEITIKAGKYAGETGVILATDKIRGLAHVKLSDGRTVLVRTENI